jgi:hypothetical protein
MASLAEMLIQTLGSGELEQISRQVGADPKSTEKAVSAAIPMLISALGKNAATPDGAEALTEALSRDHDGSVLNNVADLAGAGALEKDGDAILRHVLGNKRSMVETGLSQASGLDSNSVAKLLGMLAPLVMGGLGKTQREKGLDAAGIASLLGGERQQASKQLGGLAQLIDMDGDGDVADDLMNMGSKLLGGLFG